MIAVIFEVQPHPDKRQAYLDIAAALRPRLDRIDGFISIERFESLTVPGKVLSLSFWRDEAAVAAWRRGGRWTPTARLSRPDAVRFSLTIGCGWPPLCGTTA